MWWVYLYNSTSISFPRSPYPQDSQMKSWIKSQEKNFRFLRYLDKMLKIFQFNLPSAYSKWSTFIASTTKKLTKNEIWLKFSWKKKVPLFPILRKWWISYGLYSTFFSMNTGANLPVKNTGFLDTRFPLNSSSAD